MHSESSPCCPYHSRHEHFEDNSPVLLETFVERPRFAGTCYAAANWTRVGATQGRGKLDRYGQGGKPIKDIWLYPLNRSFRTILTDGRLPAEARIRQ